MQEERPESEYRTIEEILEINKEKTIKLKEELEFMENNEADETLESVANSIKADNMSTIKKKGDFINKVRSGLVADIKRNKGVRMVEPDAPKKRSIKEILTNIFTKF